MPVWTIATHTLSNNAQSYGNKLINELTNRGIISTNDDLTDPHTLKRIFSANNSISEITKAYRAIVGRNLNKTSLILYSGPSQPLYTQTFDHTFWTERSIGNATSSTFSSPIWTYNYPYQAGWLGCGDAPLSSATNLSNLIPYLATISCLRQHFPHLTTARYATGTSNFSTLSDIQMKLVQCALFPRTDYINIPIHT